MKGKRGELVWEPRDDWWIAMKYIGKKGGAENRHRLE